MQFDIEWTPPRRAAPPSSRSPPAAAPAAPTSSRSPRPVCGKSEVARRVEEMQHARQARRRAAAEAHERRAAEALAAEAQGGLQTLEFLNQIKSYRAAHNLAAPTPWSGAHVWQHDASSTRVVVRKRPMLALERRRLDYDVVSAEADGRGLVVHEPRTRVDLTKEVRCHRFRFDACFNEVDSTEGVYAAAVAPLVAHVLRGGAATCFAFGQTGSGKSCTMAGCHGDGAAADGNGLGVYALAAADLFGAALIAS